MAEALPKIAISSDTEQCCPAFDPSAWDGREFSFAGLEFVEAVTRSFMYVPLNMGKVMTRTQALIDAAGAKPDDRYLMLSKDVSPWKAVHRFLVTKAVPTLPSVRIEGTWLAKCYDGPYNKLGQWYSELSAEARRRSQPEGMPPTDMMAFYATCPRCAQKTGHNHIVLFARLGSS